MDCLLHDICLDNNSDDEPCDCIGRFIGRSSVCYRGDDGRYHPIDPLPASFDRLATVKDARKTKGDWKRNLGMFDSAGISGGSVHYRGQINYYGLNPEAVHGIECNGYGDFIMCMACT